MLDEQAANARKRKREEDGESSDLEGVEPEAPIPSSVKKGKQTKKQKREEKGAAGEPSNSKLKDNGAVNKPEEDPEAVRKAKAEKKRQKKERKKAKEEAKAAKAKAKKERKAQEAALEKDSKAAAGVPDASDEEQNEDVQGGEIDDIEMEDILEESRDHPSATATPSTARSPAFDASATHSGSSSISSIAAPTTEDLQPQDSHASNDTQSATQPPKPDPAELKARLAQRIEDLRKSRHADGPDGAPARTRQELIEQRRQKEETRRAHKKELRQKAKEEERQKQAETLARGSPLLSNSPLLSPGSPLTPSSEPTNFSFNRIAFSNGHHASTNLSSLSSLNTKAKGPSDPHTALLAAEKKAARLNALDSDKRTDISEKDTWLNARKRAHGERIRDDTSLLKKTLKRKDKQKKKSEKEWNERIEGVKKGQDIRQKKREANILKRKEEKGGGTKGKGGKKGKPKARPGFEGSFRAKAPSTQGPRRR